MKRFAHIALLSFMAAMLLLLAGNSAVAGIARTFTNGGGDGYWGTLTNWNPMGRVGTSDTAIIPTGLTCTVNTVSTYSNVCGAVIINGTLTFTRTATYLTVNGDVTLTGTLTFPSRFGASGSTLNIGGNFASGGTFNRGTGTVNFNGTSPQTVGTRSYQNLGILSGGTKTLSGATSVYGTLTVDSLSTLNCSTNLLTIRANATLKGTVSGSQGIAITSGGGFFGGGTAYITGGSSASYGNITNTGLFSIQKNCYLAYTSSYLTFSGSVYITSGGGFFGGSRTVTNNGIVVLPRLNGSSNTNSRWTQGTNSSLTVTQDTLLYTGRLTATATGNTVIYASSGAQIIKAVNSNGNVNYYHLTSTNGGARTIPSGSTIGIAGIFTPGTSSYTTTGSTVNFNGTVFQRIPGLISSQYNNLTISNAHTVNSIRLDSINPIRINGAFSVTATFTTGGFVNTTSRIDFTSASSQNIIAFNYYDLYNSGNGPRVLAATGTVGIAGAFSPGSGAYTITGSTVNFNGTVSQTVYAPFKFNNLVISSARTTNTVTMMSAVDTILGTFTPTATFTTGGGYVLNTNTIDFQGTGTQTIPAFNYYSLYSSTGGARTLANAGIIGVAGTFTPGAHTYTTTGSTVGFNGIGAQLVPATFVYNNIAFDSSTVSTPTAGLRVNGNLTIVKSTATFVGSSFTDTIKGNWTNNGIFTTGTSTVVLPGSNIIIGGSADTTSFNNLVINATSTNDSITQNINVASITMLAGDTLKTRLTKYINIRTESARDTSSLGIMTGIIKRTHSFNSGKPYAFESRYNRITLNGTTTSVTSVTDTVIVGPVMDYFLGTAINRQYSIAITGTYIGSADLALHYLPSDTVGLLASKLHLLRRINFGNWADSLACTILDTVRMFGGKSGVGNVASRWTLGVPATVYDWRGKNTSNWNDATSWTSPDTTAKTWPGPADVARFGDSSFTKYPILNQSVAVKGMVFGGDRSITLTLGLYQITSTGVIAAEGNAAAARLDTILSGTQPINITKFLLASNGYNDILINSTGGILTDNGPAIIAGSSTIDYGSGGNIIFGGDLSQSGGTINTPAGTFTLGGNFTYTSGTFYAPSGTVRYTGGIGGQTIGGVTYYNLTIAKTTGTTALLNSIDSVSKNFTDSLGSFTVNAVHRVKNVIINSGATLDGGISNIRVSGNWTLNSGGTFTPNAGSVTFDGSSAQTITGPTPATSAVPFNNLVINSSSTVTLSNDSLRIAGNFIDSAGTFDMSTYNVANGPAGGGSVLLIGSSSYVKTQSHFLTSFGAYNLATVSTVEYYGAARDTIDPGFTYGNLTLTGSTKDMLVDQYVGGTVTINSTAYLNIKSRTLYVGGNWNNLNSGAGALISDSSTVVFNGTRDSIVVAGNSSFNNLLISGTTVTKDNVTTSGNFQIDGTFIDSVSTNTVSCQRNFTNDGQFISTGTLNFNGSLADTITFGPGFTMYSPGTVIFNNSNYAPVFISTPAPTFYNVQVLSTLGVSFQSDLIANGTFFVQSNSSFNGNTFIDYFNGDFTNNGQFIDSSLVVFTTTSAQNITLGSNFNTYGIVQFAGSASPTFTGTGNTFTNAVQISNTAANGVTLPASCTINGDLSVDSLGVLNLASNSYTFKGSVTNNGSISGIGTSTVNISTSPDTSVHSHTVSGAGSTAFDNLVISDTTVVPQEILIAKTLTANSYLNANGGAITFTGTSDGSITGSTTRYPEIGTLNVTKSSGTLTIGLQVDSLALFNIVNSTVDAGTSQIIEAAGRGSMVMSSSAVFKVGGTAVMPVFTSGYILDTATTVIYYGSTQIITPISTGYWNLVLTDSTPTINNSQRINGNLLMKHSPIVNGSDTISVKGSIYDTAATGPITLAGLVWLNGTGAQSLGKAGGQSLVFNSLTVDSSSAKTMYTNIEVAKKLLLTSGGLVVNTKALTIDSVITRTYGHLIANGTGDSVAYNQSTTATMQAVLDTAYNKLELKNIAKKNLAGSVSAGTLKHTGGNLLVDQNFTITGAATFATIDSITNSKTLTLGTTTNISDLGDIGVGSTLINGNGALNLSGTLSDNHGTITALANGGPMTFATVSNNHGNIIGGSGAVIFVNFSSNNGNITGGNGLVTFTLPSTALYNSSGTIQTGTGSVWFKGQVILNGGAIISPAKADSVKFSGILTVNTGGTLSLANDGMAIADSTVNKNGTGAFTLSPASTFKYDGTRQTIAAAGYGNLILAGRDTAQGLSGITVQDSISLSQHLKMAPDSVLTLASNSGDNVSGKGSIMGSVRRTNTLNALTLYSFNSDSVRIALASNTTHALTITMRPDSNSQTPPTSRYIKRYYGLSGNIAGDVLSQIVLFYDSTEIRGGAVESKLSIRVDSSALWRRIGSAQGATARRTISDSGISRSLASVTEFGIMTSAFVAIRTGNYDSVSTWDALTAFPHAGDDAEIGKGYTVTVTSATDSVQSLVVTKLGSPQGQGTLTISNPGTLNVGKGGLIMQGILNIDAGRYLYIKTSNFLLDGQVINNGFIDVQQ